MKKLIVALVLCSSAVLAKADSIVIPFSGSGSSGTIAPGEPWSINDYGTYSWGSRGGEGTLAWASPVGDITGLTIHFLGLPNGVVIDDIDLAPPKCGGGTKLCPGPGTLTGIGWTPTLSADGSTVTFDAPVGILGIPLGPGQHYLVIVNFSGNEGDSVSFTGGWISPVPEPGTVWLLGAGLAALGDVVRRRRSR